MHPYGVLSLAPPVIAVVLAIVTRRILLSVLVGLFAGAMLTTGGDPVRAFVDLCEAHLWPTFVEPGKLRLFAFTMAMGATVGLLHAAGGMQGIVALMTPLARGPRSAQLTGWLLGLIVFFDDYANTLLLGGALRSVFDRLKLSREKLAYLVDSTAAPVAGIAVVSTWVAVEISYIQEGLDNLVGGEFEGSSAFTLFIACLPYRFYVIQALLFVPLVAIVGREFGPMLAAERAARNADDEITAKAGGPSEELPMATHWSNAVVPLGVTLATVTALLWLTGKANLGGELDPNASWLICLRDVFGAAESGLSLMYGGLAGLATAVGMVRWRQLLPPAEMNQALLRGVVTVLPAVAILWLAGSMSRMTGNRDIDGTPSATAYEHADVRLYTGEYLSVKLLGEDNATPSATLRALLPTGVFVMSAIVAFCTGTSFGTMGLVVPMVVPIAYSAAASAGGDDPTAAPLFLASLGGVLAGAIFGDHCSPISDTTILSSHASGCDHMAHVRTQLPYALAVASVAVLLGTLPLALGISVWVLLPIQTGALLALLYILGKPA